MTDDPHHDHKVREDAAEPRKPDDADDSTDIVLNDADVAADEADTPDDDYFGDDEPEDEDFDDENDFDNDGPEDDDEDELEDNEFDDEDEPEDDELGDEDDLKDEPEDDDAHLEDEDEDSSPAYPLYKLERDPNSERLADKTRRIDVGTAAPPNETTVEIPIQQNEAPADSSADSSADNAADDSVADGDVEDEVTVPEPSADGSFSSDKVLDIPADDVPASDVDVTADDVPAGDVTPDHEDTATQVEPVADDIPDDIDEAREVAAFGAMATPTEDAEPSPESEPAPAEVYTAAEHVNDNVDDSISADDTADEGREESFEQDATNSVNPVEPLVTPPAPPTPSHQTSPEVTAMTTPPMTAKERLAARARQLKLDAARGWVAQRKYNGAAQWLIELVEEAPTTPEAETARALLLDIAAAHEAAGRTRLALGLYDKMQQLP